MSRSSFAITAVINARAAEESHTKGTNYSLPDIAPDHHLYISTVAIMTSQGQTGGVEMLWCRAPEGILTAQSGRAHWLNSNCKQSGFHRKTVPRSTAGSALTDLEQWGLFMEPSWVSTPGRVREENEKPTFTTDRDYSTSLGQIQLSCIV